MNVAELIKKKYSGRSEQELLEVIEKLSAQIMRQNIYLFGSRKERYEADPEGMKLLFNEAEEILETAAPEEDEAHTEKPDSDGKKKARGKRKPLPDHLPRVQKIFDLPETEKSCPVHQVGLVKIGEESTEKLEIEPAKVYVVENITFRYKCPCCEDLKVVSAERPADPIPKSFATSGLLAYVATQKYVDGSVLQKAAEKMRDGPSNPPFRRRVQTTISCVAKEAA